MAVPGLVNELAWSLSGLGSASSGTELDAREPRGGVVRELEHEADPPAAPIFEHPTRVG